MAVWCICFELSADPLPEEAPDIRAFMCEAFPDVPQALESLGSSVQVSSSACLLDSELSADEIMERLWPHVLNKRERILVLPITRGVPWRIHSGETDEAAIGWIAQHLGP